MAPQPAAAETPPAAAPVQPPGASPFAPVVRAPRTPWVNPARRGHVAALAIVGALVVLLSGFGIGFAVAPSGHRHHNHGPVRMHDGYGPAMRPGHFLPPRIREEIRRHMPRPGQPGPGSASPSGSPTS